MLSRIFAFCKELRFFNVKGMTKSHIFVNSKSRFNFTFLNHHGKPQIAACSQSRKGRMVESLLILTFLGKKLRGDCFNTCLILDSSQRYYFHVSIFHFPLSSFNVFFLFKGIELRTIGGKGVHDCCATKTLSCNTMVLYIFYILLRCLGMMHRAFN